MIIYCTQNKVPLLQLPSFYNVPSNNIKELQKLLRSNFNSQIITAKFILSIKFHNITCTDKVWKDLLEAYKNECKNNNNFLLLKTEDDHNSCTKNLIEFNNNIELLCTNDIEQINKLANTMTLLYKLITEYKKKGISIDKPIILELVCTFQDPEVGCINNNKQVKPISEIILKNWPNEKNITNKYHLLQILFNCLIKNNPKQNNITTETHDKFYWNSVSIYNKCTTNCKIVNGKWVSFSSEFFLNLISEEKLKELCNTEFITTPRQIPQTTRHVVNKEYIPFANGHKRNISYNKKNKKKKEKKEKQKEKSFIFPLDTSNKKHKSNCSGFNNTPVTTPVANIKEHQSNDVCSVNQSGNNNPNVNIINNKSRVTQVPNIHCTYSTQRTYPNNNIFNCSKDSLLKNTAFIVTSGVIGGVAKRMQQPKIHITSKHYSEGDENCNTLK